jgi:hypothetical protein
MCRNIPGEKMAYCGMWRGLDYYKFFSISDKHLALLFMIEVAERKFLQNISDVLQA